MSNSTYTHPDVLTRGVEEGWADPITDPTAIDWAPRQAAAAIWFEVRNGRPLNPHSATGIRYGRGELGHWGELQAADAIVTATTTAGRWVLMVERDDDHGWAICGGMVEPNEDPADTAVREGKEETGIDLAGMPCTVWPARYVPDPRASDEAWIVTWPVLFDLGEVAELPAVAGADDARRAAWVRADTYAALVASLEATHQGQVFAAHQAMLAELLAALPRTPAFSCPEHQAFHQRAMAALDLALAGDQVGARAAVLEVPAHHGPGALTSALLVWIDTLITRTPGDLQRRVAGRALADAETAEPVTRWAAQMIAARITRDKPAFEALRTAIPKGPAAVEAHVMGLLTLVATYRADEMRTSR
ncbi:NUDIX domain-containing protein [Streptosporangium roseum]|uniref:NUDIX domain-containing protein n=1 Tax=Streptosporangium roseum TaxID=2001 RepID=UPI00333099F8